MEKFLWWSSSVCNDLWIQVKLQSDTLHDQSDSHKVD